MGTNDTLVSSETEALAAFVADATKADLPEDVVEKTKLHVLDTLAACVSGSRLRAGRLATDYVRTLRSAGPCMVIGADFRADPVNAALANGMMAHADETDDSHLGGRFHPGCGIVPAALAAAELSEADGASFLKAVALGYDVGARFNLALGPRKLYAGGHSTHSVGPLFGATAATAALLGFRTEQIRHHLSYSVQQASGVQCWSRDEEHVEKAFDFGGMPARNALAGATMVVAGFTGVSDALSGPNDFFSAFSAQPDRAALVRGLGERYEIRETSIKKWCVGSPIQAAMDAVADILAKGPLDPDTIERIVVELPDDRAALVDNRRMPNINVQHLVALMLIDGRLDFASSHDPARMEDSRLLRLRERTRLVPNAELTHADPPRQAIVRIELVDGSVREWRTRAVRGTPANPMSRSEVAAKALDLVAPVLGIERGHELCRVATSLEDVRNVGVVLQPLLAS